MYWVLPWECSRPESGIIQSAIAIWSDCIGQDRDSRNLELCALWLVLAVESCVAEQQEQSYLVNNFQPLKTAKKCWVQAWITDSLRLYTLAKTELVWIPKKCGGISSNGFHIKWIIGTHSNWKKSKFWEALLELPAKRHSQFGQFGPILR